MVRKIRTRSPGMEVFVQLEPNESGYSALFIYGGECAECTAGTGRYEKTGVLRDFRIVDMGMALVLKDSNFQYILNLEKSLSHA